MKAAEREEMVSQCIATLTRGKNRGGKGGAGGGAVRQGEDWAASIVDEEDGVFVACSEVRRRKRWQAMSSGRGLA